MLQYGTDNLLSPTQILQQLIRYNTTNPPGEETECIQYIADILRRAGLEPIFRGKSPQRQNLIVRLEGSGEAPPFLMYGHADVVTADQQNWRYPPFEGAIGEGCIWGRGALDMKGGLAMMVSALLMLKKNGVKPRGDIMLAVLCDEENGGVFGAKYLVEKHGELFRDIRYAIGEVGGFTFYIGTKRFYPVMISEKQRCSLRAVIKGEGGHGSLPVKNGAMAKLGRLLWTLDQKWLPAHVTAPAKSMIEGIAEHMPFPGNAALHLLLNSALTDKVLRLLGEKAAVFVPLLHHTVSATIIKGGSMINVIPSEVSVDLDGRLLPGYSPDDLLRELKQLVKEDKEDNEDIDFEVTYYSPGPSRVDMGLFNTLADILIESDPEALPIPYLNAGVTDARFFCRLGIQTYGFTPMLLSKEFSFSRMIHGVDERIPIEALNFGTNAIYSLLGCMK